MSLIYCIEVCLSYHNITSHHNIATSPYQYNNYCGSTDCFTAIATWLITHNYISAISLLSISLWYGSKNFVLVRKHITWLETARYAQVFYSRAIFNVCPVIFHSTKDCSIQYTQCSTAITACLSIKDQVFEQ